MQKILVVSFFVLFTACVSQDRRSITFEVPGPTPTSTVESVDSIVVKNIAPIERVFLLSYGILDARTGEKLDYVAETIAIKPSGQVTRNAARGRVFVAPEIKETE